MNTFPELVALAGRATDPGNRAPWPGALDTARWVWDAATPRVWQEEYDPENTYSAYMSNPRVWGLTGASYTSSTINEVTPGWTMGEATAATLKYAPPASFGYRLWQAALTPVTWIRDITDRTAARLDPRQAIVSELDTLARWADVDPVAVRHLDPAISRRVTAYQRALEQFRGADGSGVALSAMLGSSVALSWSSDHPYLRVVSTYAQSTPNVRRLLRRNLPPHVLGELHAFSGNADYTGGAWTAKYTDADGNVPGDAMYALTSTLTETVETF